MRRERWQVSQHLCDQGVNIMGSHFIIMKRGSTIPMGIEGCQPHDASSENCSDGVSLLLRALASI